MRKGMFHDFRCIREIARKIPHCYFRVTAIADKLGVEFALIHRTATSGAEEHVHVLVGDVRDKVCLRVSYLTLRGTNDILLGSDFGGRHDRHRKNAGTGNESTRGSRRKGNILPRLSRVVIRG